MGVDLGFVNNQSWLLIYDVSRWVPLYDFTKVKLRMQIRAQTHGSVIYAFSNFAQPGARGVITYVSPNVLLISATYSDVRRYLSGVGVYVHDLTIEVDDPVSGLPIVVRSLTNGLGNLTISDGVTIQ